MKRTALLSSLLVALLAGCGKPETAPHASAPAAIVQVKVARATASELPIVFEITGTVRAVQRATLAAKLTGSITRLPLALGQPVAAGELLVEISSPEVAARLAQARAQLNLTERELSRERALLARGVTPPESVRALEDRAAIHAAQLREAETLLRYTEIRAPFAGVIARKYVDAGDLAQPGQPLIELDGSDAFEITSSVPESLAATLQRGQSLTVNAAPTGLRFDAKISEISSATDAASRAIALKLTVPADATVRPGQFVRLAVPGTPARTILAPHNAVSQVGQMERVFVVGADRRAQLRLVKTGATRGDSVEILAGLDAGETVVLTPPPSLREGSVVEVLP